MKKDSEYVKHDIVSSAISSVEYKKEKGSLRVNFTDGTIKVYLFVPEKTFKALIESSSAGRYFNEYIRDNYPHA